MKSTKSSGFQAEDGQVKEAVFGVWGRDVIDAQQRVPRSTVPAFEGAAGGSSNFINYHQNHPTVKGQNKFFEALKAGEDAVSGSKDVLKFESGYFDPNSLTPQQQAPPNPPSSRPHSRSHPSSHAHIHYSTHTL